MRKKLDDVKRLYIISAKIKLLGRKVIYEKHLT